jgi:hypothetical protein
MKFNRLLAVGSAALAFAATGNAQGISGGAPAPGTGIFPALLGATTRTAYDHHWAPMAGVPTLAWSGKGLFDFFGGPNNFGGPGDAIRVCYGIDSTQGGRNWTGGPNAAVPGPYGFGVAATGGQTENTWFRIAQGFAPQALATSAAGVDIGLITVMAGTTSALGGDNCFSPFVKGFSHASDSGGHKVAAAAIGGLFSATGVAAFPIYWEFSLSWGPTPALVDNVIGNQSASPGVPGLAVPAPMASTLPLLSNVIFEVQGPLNGAAPGQGFLRNQYYLSSTVEFAGIGGPTGPGGAGAAGGGNITLGARGLRGTGGVTNGNATMSFDLFGADAGTTNAVSASRIFTAGPAGAYLNENASLLTPLVTQTANFRNGRIEFVEQLAFQTPRMWAYHNFNSGLASGVTTSTIPANQNPPGPGAFGSPTVREGLDGNNNLLLITGNGGPDWNLSGAPVSRVDIISIDHEDGADNNGNVYNKVGIYATPNVTTPTFIGTPLSGYQHAAASFDTSLGAGGFTTTFGIFGCYFFQFNRMFMQWSVTPHSTMVQTVGSWDDFAGLALSGALSTESIFAQDPNRDGPGPGTGQGWALNPDGITTLFSTKSTLSFGTSRSASDDFFADGALDFGGNIFPTFSSLFEGMFVPQTSGQSDLKGDNKQLSPTPDPSFAGTIFYLSGAGSHINFCDPMFPFELTERTNALTITLQ